MPTGASGERAGAIQEILMERLLPIQSTSIAATRQQRFRAVRRMVNRLRGVRYSDDNPVVAFSTGATTGNSVVVVEDRPSFNPFSAPCGIHFRHHFRSCKSVNTIPRKAIDIQAARQWNRR